MTVLNKKEAIKQQRYSESIAQSLAKVIDAGLVQTRHVILFSLVRQTLLQLFFSRLVQIILLFLRKWK